MNKTKICAIMQPTYLPWLGYFDIMDQVDLFVFLDNVQFAKRSWQQRNRIKTPRGLEWLTVPVIVHGRYDQLIKDVEISDRNFLIKHLQAIEHNYRRAPYFQDYFFDLSSIFKSGDPWNYLAELNIKLIQWLTTVLGVKTLLIRVSSLKVEGKRANLLAEICQKVDATGYFSALGSIEYLLDEIKEFTNKGIKVFFHKYIHPTYNQLFPPFLPFASVIDIIFNEGGSRAMDIIRSGRGSPYSPEEIRSKITNKI